MGALYVYPRCLRAAEPSWMSTPKAEGSESTIGNLSSAINCPRCCLTLCGPTPVPAPRLPSALKLQTSGGLKHVTEITQKQLLQLSLSLRLKTQAPIHGVQARSQTSAKSSESPLSFDICLLSVTYACSLWHFLSVSPSPSWLVGNQYKQTLAISPHQSFSYAQTCLRLE